MVQGPLQGFGKQSWEEKQNAAKSKKRKVKGDAAKGFRLVNRNNETKEQDLPSSRTTDPASPQDSARVDQFPIADCCLPFTDKMVYLVIANFSLASDQDMVMLTATMYVLRPNQCFLIMR